MSPTSEIPRLLTQSGLARLAGVSRQTVQRALMGHPDVNPATREHVVKLAQAHSYRPNAFARAMRSGRFNSVGLLLSTESARSNFPARLFDGIHEGLSEAGLRLTLSKLADEKLASAGAIPELLEELSVDGLLINYTHRFPAAMEQLILQHTVPSVWINSVHESDCVYPEDDGAARQATEMLLNLGHRRIAYLATINRAHYSVGARERGYAQAMADAGLEGRSFTAPDESLLTEERARLCQNIMGVSDRPTACVAYGLDDALTLLFAAQSQGLSIPQDLSVVTFGDHASGAAGILMSTMLAPEKEMGRQAVQMLLSKIATPHRPLPPVAVPFTLKFGGTVAPPSGV